MENQYIISESELLDLLSACYYAQCLDEAGVDNWSWYMINREEFLGEFDSFDDKAKNVLKYYTKIEK